MEKREGNIDISLLDEFNPVTQQSMRIVETLLSDGLDHSFTEICKELKKKQDRPTIPTQRTLQNIIYKMRYVYGNSNDVKSTKGYKRIDTGGRSQTDTLYWLQNTEFLIFPEEIFTKKDKELLSKLLNIIVSFNGVLPIDTILQKLDISRIAIGNALKGRIELEPNPYLEKWISPLYDSIANQETIKITYSQLHTSPIEKDEEKEYILSPYYLKCYGGRWFLIAHIHGERYEWSVFPLDRINSIAKAEKKKFKHIDVYRIKEYYESVIGFYVPIKDKKNPPVNYNASRLKVLHIEIEAMDKDTYYYIKSNPIHSSQICNDKYLTIEIDVIENPSLIMKLLSYGHNIKVLEPSSIRENIIEEAFKTINLYKTK